MKIQIFGTPRSGTTCLYEALVNNINYTVGIYEPLNPAWTYKASSNNEITKHLNILNNCNINIIEKNILESEYYVSSNLEGHKNISVTKISKDLSFYKSYLKNFDKLIFLYRKNIDETAKSLAIALFTENFYYPYKNIDINYEHLLPLVKTKNKMVEELADYFKSPLIYYEDLYSNNIDFINYFLKYFDIKVNNLDRFYFTLDTQHRLKK